jgi:hypothetical protein
MILIFNPYFNSTISTNFYYSLAKQATYRKSSFLRILLFKNKVIKQRKYI